MLQQTRVATVLPYWDAFVERFPTIEDLAAAPIDEVLALWSGLGYYRRARQLHAAARRVVEEGGGEMPRDAAGLRELPGIGEYTAAAIASIAFDEPVPVVDGNVERVISRLLAFDGDPKRSKGRRTIREAAAVLIDPGRPGGSNQALMELGATVCLPKAPSCLLCPLGEICAGRSTPEAFPVARRRRAVEKVDLTAAIVVRNDPSEGERVLLFRRREDDSLLAGMWELPHAPRRESRRIEAEDLSRHYGGRFEIDAVSEHAAAEHTVRHAITHRAITFHAHRARWSETAGDDAEIEAEVESTWASRSDRENLAVSSAVEKILAKMLGG